MRTVVVGANGQLGSDLSAYWEHRGNEVIRLTHQDLAIEDPDQTASVLMELKPDLILTTAAFHVVPQCEKEPARAFEVNALGARNLARAGEQIDASVMYFSTDYVFDGRKHAPYLETDLPNPLNVYGHTKLSGEYFTLNECRRGYVVRVSGIYGAVPCRAKGGNFITTMLRLAKEKPEVKVIDDEILTPTPTTAIAEAAYEIALHGEPGLYHATAEGQCSWHEFAGVIFETLKLRTPLLPISSNEMPAGVRRPLYSVLENYRMNNASNFRMPHWRDGLISFLRQMYGG